MAKIFQCNFMKCNIIQGFEQHHHTKKQDRYLDFMTQFPSVNISEKHFHRKSADIYTFHRKRLHWGDKKKVLILDNSKEVWKNLSDDNQNKHTLHNCTKCEESKDLNKNITSTPLRHAINSIEIPVLEPNQIKQPYLVEAASSILNELNNSWKSVYNTSFIKFISKTPGVALTPRKNKAEKQNELRKIHRKIK